MQSWIPRRIRFVIRVRLKCVLRRSRCYSGRGIEAAAEASRLFLRPFLITSLAFILGVLPLVIDKRRGGRNGSGIGYSFFRSIGIGLATTFVDILVK